MDWKEHELMEGIAKVPEQTQPTYYCPECGTGKVAVIGRKCEKCKRQAWLDDCKMDYEYDEWLVAELKRFNGRMGRSRIKITPELWIRWKGLQWQRHQLKRMQDIGAPNRLIEAAERLVSEAEGEYLVVYVGVHAKQLMERRQARMKLDD